MKYERYEQNKLCTKITFILFCKGAFFPLSLHIVGCLSSEPCLLPNARVVTYERCRKWPSGGEQSGAAAIVTVRVDSRNVFDLLEVVHLFLGKLCLEEANRTLVSTMVGLQFGR